MITRSGVVAWTQHSQDGSLNELPVDLSGLLDSLSQHEMTTSEPVSDFFRQQEAVVSLFLQQLASEAAARLQQHGRFEQTGAKTTAIASSNRWRAPLCEIAFSDTSVSVAVGGFVVVRDVWHNPAP